MSAALQALWPRAEWSQGKSPELTLPPPSLLSMALDRKPEGTRDPGSVHQKPASRALASKGWRPDPREQRRGIPQAETALPSLATTLALPQTHIQFCFLCFVEIRVTHNIV